MLLASSFKELKVADDWRYVILDTVFQINYCINLLMEQLAIIPESEGLYFAVDMKWLTDHTTGIHGHVSLISISDEKVVYIVCVCFHSFCFLCQPLTIISVGWLVFSSWSIARMMVTFYCPSISLHSCTVHVPRRLVSTSKVTWPTFSRIVVSGIKICHLLVLLSFEILQPSEMWHPCPRLVLLIWQHLSCTPSCRRMGIFRWPVTHRAFWGPFPVCHAGCFSNMVHLWGTYKGWNRYHHNKVNSSGNSNSLVFNWPKFHSCIQLHCTWSTKAIWQG